MDMTIFFEGLIVLGILCSFHLYLKRLETGAYTSEHQTAPNHEIAPCDVKQQHKN